MRFKHVFVLTALVSVLLIAAGAARVAALRARGIRAATPHRCRFHLRHVRWKLQLQGGSG